MEHFSSPPPVSSYNPSFENFVIHPTRCAESCKGKVAIFAVSFFFNLLTVGTFWLGYTLKNCFSKDAPPAAAAVDAAASPLLAPPPADAPPEHPEVDLSERIFHTVTDIRTADAGNYEITTVPGHTMQVMKVKYSDNVVLSRVIRPSEKFPGMYRMMIGSINANGQTHPVWSMFPFTKDQIRSFIVTKHHIPQGFELSGLTEALKLTGIIILKMTGTEDRYTFNNKGYLQKIDDIRPLLELARQLARK